MNYDRGHLSQRLRNEEGVKLLPYKDSVGKLTIGVGHNLTDDGISDVICTNLLNEDLNTAEGELLAYFPWMASLDPVRLEVMMDMIFNMGPVALSQFTNTLKAVRDGRWADAAAGMRGSLWAQQVGQRAENLAKQMETGQYVP